jgi:anti-anti-sigma factor
MSEPPTEFEINESREGNAVRLRLSGELDLASAPALRQRLEELRMDGQAVRLDLVDLEFIDSNGIHVLFDAFRSASADGWAFRIDPRVSPQVMRVLQVVNLDQLIIGDEQTEPQRAVGTPASPG